MPKKTDGRSANLLGSLVLTVSLAGRPKFGRSHHIQGRDHVPQAFRCSRCRFFCDIGTLHPTPARAGSVALFRNCPRNNFQRWGSISDHEPRHKIILGNPSREWPRLGTHGIRQFGLSIPIRFPRLPRGRNGRSQNGGNLFSLRQTGTI